MSFFKKLFNKSADSDSSSSKEKPATPAQKFDKEFHDIVPRYLCNPDIEKVDLEMRNKDTNAVLTFAEAYPEQFAEWKTVQSLPDRRGIIYKILDKAMGKDIKIWQVIERFVDDRYPEHALKVAREYVQSSDLNADFYAAVAKAYLVLTDYKEAENNAREALKYDANHMRAKIVLADALHETGKFEEAHEIYNEVLKARLPQSNEPVSLSFAQLVGFNGNILPSAIYAIAWLENHPDTTIDTWNWANDEFYYSPHFRAQFAYYLLKQKEELKGIAKLYSLVKEMPWYKEAVINCWRVMHQLGMAPNMANEIAHLEEIMKKNGWDPNAPGKHNFTL